MTNAQGVEETVDVRLEDGSRVVRTAAALLEHTYDKVAADVFQYEGFQISLFDSKEERSNFKAWLLYSEWACGASPDDYTVDMFKERFDLYLRDCGCSLVVNVQH